jgi:hypothetical protein
MSSTNTARNSTAPTQVLQANGHSYAYRRFGNGSGLPVNASASGQFRIGDISVNRLGYGAMRITGPGIWGAPGQVALAWLLKRSPVILPIPGTLRIAHLEENVAAAGVSLTSKDIAELDAMT